MTILGETRAQGRAHPAAVTVRNADGIVIYQATAALIGRSHLGARNEG